MVRLLHFSCHYWLDSESQKVLAIIPVDVTFYNKKGFADVIQPLTVRGLSWIIGEDLIQS